MLKEYMQEMKLTSLTLEWGKGETYRNGAPTVYGHGTYPRSSVLAGQSRRVFMNSYDSPEEARNALKEQGLKYTDMLDSRGTTHIPVAQKTAHLRDEEDL